MFNRGDSRTLTAIVTTAILSAAITSLLVRPDNTRMRDLETRVRTLEIAAARIPPIPPPPPRPCDPLAAEHDCK